MPTFPPEYFVFDIETIHDTQFPSPEDGAFPPGHQHQVVAIGMAKLDRKCRLLKKGMFSGLDEASILDKFSRTGANFITAKEAIALVTWNGRGFDFPTIVARCMKHLVQIPWYYTARDVRYRYSFAGHVDLMDWFRDHGAGRWPMSLNDAAVLCGISGKTSDGPKVAEMVAENRWDELKNYCFQDVRITGTLLARHLYTKGELTKSEYITAEKSWDE